MTVSINPSSRICCGLAMFRGATDTIPASSDVEGSGYQLNCCSLLAEVAEEHNLNLTYREVLGPHGEHERGLGLVQVSSEGRSRPCDLICLGEGADPGQARQVAARTALIYLKMLTGGEKSTEKKESG